MKQRGPAPVAIADIGANALKFHDNKWFFTQYQCYLHSVNREQGLTRSPVLIEDARVENTRSKHNLDFWF